MPSTLRNFVTAALAALLCTACNQTDKAEAPPNGEHAATASADIAILAADSSSNLVTGFSKNLVPAQLNNQELQLTDSLLRHAVEDYNTHMTPAAGDSLYAATRIDLNNYKRQYVAVAHANGAKEVWVNCFCKDIEKRIEFTDWKSMPVKVLGGGNCFFQVKLDLAAAKAYDWNVNGSK